MKNALNEIFSIYPISQNLFECALTHTSVINELSLPYTNCYERLEFLGDAVLKLIASDLLYKRFPTSPEGELSKIRSIIVSDNILADIAKKNGLQKLIRISKHEEKQGCRNLNSVCACAFEAVLGAYYIEGKYNELKKYLGKVLPPYIEDAQNHFEKFNAKAILQEYTQEKTKTVPKYEVVREIGPDHKKIFEVQVEYDGKILATEQGTSKKEAEQKCAYSACKKFGVIQ